ncbi:MAG: hypothetical protein FWC73_02600 [Defluviitaleaceae bacterium]|nr:hypothetical protein [Defluviitaleaceae bacterium]
MASKDKLTIGGVIILLAAIFGLLNDSLDFAERLRNFFSGDNNMNRPAATPAPTPDTSSNEPTQTPQPAVTHIGTARIRYITDNYYFPFSATYYANRYSDGYIRFNLSSNEPTGKALRFAGWLRDNNSNNRIYPLGYRMEIYVGVLTENAELRFYPQMLFDPSR